jgi:hypothetical protein
MVISDFILLFINRWWSHLRITDYSFCAILLGSAPSFLTEAKDIKNIAKLKVYIPSLYKYKPQFFPQVDAFKIRVQPISGPYRKENINELSRSGKGTQFIATTKR